MVQSYCIYLYSWCSALHYEYTFKAWWN